MNISASDLETIGETSAQAFKLYQQGPVDVLVELKNVGVNDIVYVFQQYTGGSWADLGVLGTVYNDTLAADDSVGVPIDVDSAQVRLLCSASGGSTLFFAFLTGLSRGSGGALPLINY